MYKSRSNNAQLTCPEESRAVTVGVCPVAYNLRKPLSEADDGTIRALEGSGPPCQRRSWVRHVHWWTIEPL